MDAAPQQPPEGRPQRPPRWICCWCSRPVEGNVYFEAGNYTRPHHKACLPPKGPRLYRRTP